MLCRRSLVLIVALCGVLLCPSSLADTESAESRKAPAENVTSFSFAGAMDQLAPLVRVPGRGDSESESESDVCASASTSAERYTEALRYAEDLGSYSLFVWRAGECELAHYFPPFDDSLRPDSASMHKSVVALLLAAAIADGFIDSADDPVGRYIPEWRDDFRGAVTLRSLLTMSSGLEPFSRDGGTDSPSWRYVMGPDDPRAETLGRPLNREPGEVFHYSGFNTQMLLMVIEAATRRGYVDYLAERLWQPLGNGDAYVWKYEGGARMPRAYTALLATARDWLRVGLLIKDFGRYGDRQLIPEALIRDMTSPSAANPNYGWQLWLGTEYQPVRYYNRQREGMAFSSAEPFAVDDMIYFDGIGGQRVYISRSLDLVIVRQGDSRSDWDDTRLPNLIIRTNQGDAK